MTLVSYAQNFEDVMLWRALGAIEHGRYLDVGAQDPVVDSVSKAFYDRGWRGWHVEPTRVYSEALRRARPDENVLVAAVGMSGLMKFQEFPETGLSTLDAGIAADHVAKGFAHVERSVVGVPLADILEQMAEEGPIHWMKIDVEGAEREVLESWGDCSVRPWVLVIESTLPLSQEQSHEQWEPLVLSRGYQFAYFDGLNRYYVADQHVELLQKFDAPPNVFDDFSLSGTASQPFCRYLLEQVRVSDEGRAAADAALSETLERLNEQTAVLTLSQDARAQAEEARARAEEARARAEDARSQSENARAQAEDARAQADAALSDVQRRLDEQAAALVLSQDARAHAERALAHAESARGQAEDARADSERALIAAQDAVVRWQVRAEFAERQNEEFLAELSTRFDAALAQKLEPALESVLHWQSVVHQSSERAAALQGELDRSLGNAHHWFVEHGKLREQLDHAEARLAAVLDSNHGWFVRAGELEKQLDAFQRSSSWRITAPLRATRRLLTRPARSMLLPPALWTIRRLRARPGLWRVASALMKRHAALFERLKTVAVAHGAVPAPPPALLVAAAHANAVGASALARGDAFEPAMSAYQHDLLKRLKGK